MLAFAAVAPGQPPFGGWPTRASGGLEWLLQNSDVRKELKITPSQRTKIGELSRSLHEKHRPELERLKNEGANGRAKMLALMANISEESAKEMETVLSPEQMKRLRQIGVQALGLEAFFDPGLERELGLTPEQKEKLATIASDMHNELRNLINSHQGDFEAGVKKVRQIRKQSVDKALTVLSDDQRKAWEQIAGAPFDLKFMPTARRRPEGLPPPAKP
jgi:hypothetical protein